MPYNPGGLFSLVASYFATPGATIRTEQHNPVFEDVASALSNVLVRDGRAPMTGPLNMNGQPINNVVAGNSPSSVATLAQAMPIGAVIDFAGSAAPAGWALCYGQALNRATNAALFAVIGTTFGAPDGATFSLPDLRGTVTAGVDNMGGASGGRMPGLNPGTFQGVSTATLTTQNLPPYTPTGTATGPITGGATNGQITTYNGSLPGSIIIPTIINGTADARPLVVTGTFSGTTAMNSQGGTSTPVSIVQPTLGMNKIIRVSYDV